jgi:hypothetical protein
MAYLRTLKISIAPNQSWSSAINGNVIGLIASDVPVSVELDNNNSRTELEAGQEVSYFGNEDFKQIKLWHNSASVQFIEIAVGKDARLRQQKTTSDVNITGSVPLVVSGVVLTATDVEIKQKDAAVTGAVYSVTAAGVVVTAAANKNRRAVHFRNTSETIDCYLAAYPAINKQSCPIVLAAGEVLLIDDRTCAVQWYAFSDGADINIAVQEVVE